MNLIVHKSVENIYPATPDYIDAIEVRSPTCFFFVSGTMGLEADGSAGADLETQLRLIWNNIRTILASAGMNVNNIVRLTSYLRDAAYAEANASARVDALGDRQWQGMSG